VICIHTSCRHDVGLVMGRQVDTGASSVRMVIGRQVNGIVVCDVVVGAAA